MGVFEISCGKLQWEEANEINWLRFFYVFFFYVTKWKLEAKSQTWLAGKCQGDFIHLNIKKGIGAL